jgi:hypothetical protein
MFFSAGGEYEERCVAGLALLFCSRVYDRVFSAQVLVPEPLRFSLLPGDALFFWFQQQLAVSHASFLPLASQ